MTGASSHPRRLLLVVLGAALALTACSSGADEPESSITPRFVQPGAPGEPNRVLDPDEVPDLAPPEHTDDDVRFVQMMILHHEQALDMARLVPERTSREDVPLFAERIELSQLEEIEYMQRWLEERGEEVPDGDHAHDVEDMPGMLTDQELAQLESSSGEEFDRLFLDFMYFHHLGALMMVEELWEIDGAGEEPELWQLLKHIDSDQRIELSRIEMILADMDGEGGS